jgi:hypothetical protein
MNQLHHERIDKGVSKSEAYFHPQPTDNAGRFLSPYSADLKQTVIKDCYDSLLRGETPGEVGERHGVPERTVQSWLLGDERAEAARGQWIASELARTIANLKAPSDGTADHPLRLGRAREEFKAWSWIAERRESRLYGQKQEVTHTGEVTFSMALQAISQRRLERVVNVDNSPIPVDSPSQIEHTHIMSNNEDAPKE